MTACSECGEQLTRVARSRDTFGTPTRPRTSVDEFVETCANPNCPGKESDLAPAAFPQS